MANKRLKPVTYKLKNTNHLARSDRGFTLIEVLVALVIIAVALGAIMSASGSQARQTAYLKHKTLAHWVAMNEMTKLQLDTWPVLGEKKGSSTMVGIEWFWLRTVKEMEDKGARQVEFQVFSSENRKKSLTKLIGFANKKSEE